jgi:hypothetical protein
VSEVKVSICVVSDPNKLHQIEGIWNTLINGYSKNPFLLSGFIKQFMKFNHSMEWTPLVLVISVDNKIVGLSPLKMKRKFGVRFVKFLPSAWFSPDFISNEQYREICLAYTLNFLFKTLRCQFVDVALPFDSHNLQIIKQKCKTNKIHFYTKQEMGHRILPVRSTWTEFEAFRGGNFRRKFKRIKRSLDHLGTWRILCTENGKEKFDVIKKIFDIEKMSWKEEWRARTGKKDIDLLTILAGLQSMVEIEPCFRWDVWFLELNNQALAYSLFIVYKGISYCVKTSYDKRYEKLSLGIYVINAAIREFFNEHQIRKIDFLTDLPFMETWTSLRLPRVRIMMSRNSVLPSIIKLALLNKPAKDILTLLSRRAPLIADLIGL